MSGATFRAETRTTDTGATVELGTMTLEGRAFSALGSIIDPAGGFVLGYVREDAPGRFVLATWSGAEIAPLHFVCAWRQRTIHGAPYRVYAWRMTLGGRTYHGRNAGASLVLRLRANKSP